VTDSETTAGVIVLEVRVDVAGGSTTYDVIYRGRYPAVTGLDPVGQGLPMRMNWHEASSTLFVGFGCMGSAIYKFPSPFGAPAVQYRSGQGLTAYQAGYTPSGKVYVIYLQGQMEILDESVFAGGTANPVYDLRWHPNQIHEDPYAPGVQYMANGASGFCRVQLP
jgi:hypothetical protein